MSVKQYEFEPLVDDPRIFARDHWTSMRDELNFTREQLEASNANEVSLSALVDMLRRELADAKAKHERDQVALTVMRTKLRSAGSLVLEALRDDDPEMSSRLPPQAKPQPAASFSRPIAPLRAVEPEKDDELTDLIGRMPTIDFASKG